MQEKRRVMLRIAGKEIVLMSEDEAAYLKRLEEFTNRRINETALAARQPVSAVGTICTLAMADELLKAQDENRRLRIELDQLRKGEA